ncbi:MAG: N-formylglutamate deformylase [Gammaproteobacteria bacterium]
MTALFDFETGDAPLLVNVPHAGTELPDDIAAQLTEPARALPDTDWFVDKLYGFATGLGASLQVARYSRYVVDLNRPPDDAALYPGQHQSGLFPTQTFAGEDIYLPGAAPDSREKRRRVEQYWRPFHDHLRERLETIRARHGFAVLWDAHSIRAEVPGLFAGRLPDLNLGTNGAASCNGDLRQGLAGICSDARGFTSVVDGRFKGGYITRAYGQPDSDIHAIQLELAQAAYMDETLPAVFDPGRASALRAVLELLLEAVLHWCDRRGSPALRGTVG